MHSPEEEYLLLGRREVADICGSVGDKILRIAGSIIANREHPAAFLDQIPWSQL
jgi:hypothetical protein